MWYRVWNMSHYFETLSPDTCSLWSQKCLMFKRCAGGFDDDPTIPTVETRNRSCRNRKMSSCWSEARAPTKWPRLGHQVLLHPAGVWRFTGDEWVEMILMRGIRLMVSCLKVGLIPATYCRRYVVIRQSILGYTQFDQLFGCQGHWGPMSSRSLASTAWPGA